MRERIVVPRPPRNSGTFFGISEFQGKKNNSAWKETVEIDYDSLLTLVRQKEAGNIDSVLLWSTLGTRLPLNSKLQAWFEEIKVLL
jgi:hypothetical protein